MSELWDPLIQASLLGTGRKPYAAPVNAADPVAQLCGRLAAGDNEACLLSAIAIAATARRAGRSAEPSVKIPPAALPDALPPLEARAATLLQRVLKDCPALLPEFYDLCQRAGKRIPDCLLVDVLVQAESNRAIRSPLFPILGNRGQWLANLNPDWKFSGASPEATATGTLAVPDAAAIWQTGVGEQRLAAFRGFRQRQPEAARLLAESTWAQDDADTRSEVVKSFQDGLSIADEPFLESCLSDRRKEVRSAAQALLVQLPDSALAKRMLERAAGYLKIQKKPRGLLGKLAGAAETCILEIELPAECDKAMERDGVAAKVPAGMKTGERGWWLRQVLGCITPAALADRLEVTVDQLEQAVRDHAEWSKEIIAAWIEAARRCRDADAAFRLYRQHPAQAQTLLAVLRPDQQEIILAEAIAAAKPGEVREIVVQAVAAGSQLSPAIAIALLDYLRRVVAEDTSNQHYPWTLPWEQLALALPPELCARALSGWPSTGGWEHWQKHVEKFFQIVQLRADIRQALRELKTITNY